MTNLVNKIGEFNHENLFHDAKFPLAYKSVKIKKAAKPILKGTVLGIGTDGYAQAVNSKSETGPKEANCILAEDVDSSDGDVFAVAYKFGGNFNRKALIFGGSDTAEEHEETLRTVGIYMKDNI